MVLVYLVTDFDTDIGAVLGTRIATEDGCEHNFLTYAIKYNRYAAEAGILVNAGTNLRNLLEDQPMIGFSKNKEGHDTPCYLTALNYARALKKEEFVNMIEQKAHRADIEFPIHQSQPHVNTGNRAFVEIGVFLLNQVGMAKEGEMC